MVAAASSVQSHINCEEPDWFTAALLFAITLTLKRLSKKKFNEKGFYLSTFLKIGDFSRREKQYVKGIKQMICPDQ